MKRFVVSAPACGAFLVMLGLSRPTLGQHVDFEIAQDGSPAHTLIINGDPDILGGIEPIDLPLQVGGPLDGLYAGQEPGWASIEMDDPANGLFTLLPGHQVSLQRLGGSAGFLMYDTAFNPILENTGDIYTFASDAQGNLHEDLFFAAPAAGNYSLELRLIDLAGLHSPSAPVMLSFAAVPEPTSAALLVLGALTLLHRRDRPPLGATAGERLDCPERRTAERSASLRDGGQTSCGVAPDEFAQGCGSTTIQGCHETVQIVGG